jgi:uncharacterized protein
MSEFENATAAPPPPPGSAPQEDRTIALLTHLSGIIAGFIVPLIMWLINKDKPEKSWLTDSSVEALNFQITVAIAYDLLHPGRRRSQQGRVLPLSVRAAPDQVTNLI